MLVLYNLQGLCQWQYYIVPPHSTELGLVMRPLCPMKGEKLPVLSEQKM